MFHTLQASLGEALAARLTLLLNHLVAAEPAAQSRLRPHAGRCIQLQLTSWPALLPRLPVFALVITPAGLFELDAQWSGTPDLQVQIDASNPARSLAQAALGERPGVQVSGDAALAGDVQWLLDNLRWDVQDDLARLIGPMAARELTRLGAGAASGLRSALRELERMGARSRGDAGAHGGAGGGQGGGGGGPAPR